VSTVENDVLIDGYYSALADGEASRSRCETRLGQSDGERLAWGSRAGRRSTRSGTPEPVTSLVSLASLPDPGGDDELGNVSPTPFPSPCRRACGSVGRGRPRAKALIRGRDAVPGTHKIERSDRLLARFDLIKISALADVFGAQVVLHGSSV
jgi:hypothetical protein